MSEREVVADLVMQCRYSEAVEILENYDMKGDRHLISDLLVISSGNPLACDFISYLISSGANPNHVDSHKETPLEHAIAIVSSIYYRFGPFDLLIKSGASPNLRISSGLTPIHFAIQVNDVDLLSRLLESGADPRLRSQDGKTALEYSLANHRCKAAKIIEGYL